MSNSTGNTMAISNFFKTIEHPVAQWSRAQVVTRLSQKAASSIPAKGNWDFSLGKTARDLS